MVRFATDMQAADIDGDGDIDVITYQEDTGNVVWIENPRPGGDAESSWVIHPIGAEQSAHDVEVGDIDRDGKLDVITRREFGGGPRQSGIPAEPEPRGRSSS
jgi:hypothetical protein